ncbi:MAG: LysM peptidoglycan-binding domain-containing protein [Chloroflexi bacterium]|nr:LysM peptidoglycan-binding domain-containing protein [Chloroflexota bacterium]
MKKFAVQLALLLVVLLSGHFPAGAQQNLLTNPGFEDPFQTLDNNNERRVAQGWTPWHIPTAPSMPSWQNAQPVYLPTAPDRARIRSGSNAQQMFSFYTTHTGGVYQRVTGITSGTQLRFTLFAYIWSSAQNDINRSEDDGDIVARVGIDPTGGTDPTSASIVWSPNVERYDAYNEYSVTATAAGSAVTVYFESTVGRPVQNYLYLDDASLVAVGAAAPTATNTTPPTVAITNTPRPPTATVVRSTPSDGGIIPTATNTLPPTATPPPTNTLVPSSTPPPTNTTAPSATPPPTNTLPPTPTTEARLTSTPSGGAGTPPISSEFPGSIIHVVRQGETVGSIAALYGSTVEAIVEANGLNQFAFIRAGQNLIVPVRIGRPATVTPTNTPVVTVVATATPALPGGQVGSTIYVVQPGDTLNAIAARYNTTTAALAQLNGIVNPNRIQVGQRLIVPGTNVVAPTATPAPPVARPVTYVVQSGDTLFRISLRFGVSMQRLMEANGILNANRIFVGQVLVIP